MFLYIKYVRSLYVLQFIYSVHDCLAWNAFVYRVIVGGAFFLGGGLILEILYRIRSERHTAKRSTSGAVKQISFDRDKAKSDSCAICMESFKPGELVTILSCCHLYHFWCIYEWFHTKQNCPMCRRPIAKLKNQ